MYKIIYYLKTYLKPFKLKKLIYYLPKKIEIKLVA
jgi:hypothetical protein